MESGVGKLIESTLTRDPKGVNTDWDGTLLMRGLQEWEEATGDTACGDYVERWFEHHRTDRAGESDEIFYQSFPGPRGRIVWNAPIPFSAYCGHWGLVYVC